MVKKSSLSIGGRYFRGGKLLEPREMDRIIRNRGRGGPVLQINQDTWAVMRRGDEKLSMSERAKEFFKSKYADKRAVNLRLKFKPEVKEKLIVTDGIHPESALATIDKLLSGEAKVREELHRCQKELDQLKKEQADAVDLDRFSITPGTSIERFSYLFMDPRQKSVFDEENAALDVWRKLK